MIASLVQPSPMQSSPRESGPMRYFSRALLSAMLAAATLAPAQQGVTPPSAPPPGTVPITSQTPVTPGADPTAPTVAPGPDAQGKSGRSVAKHQRHKGERALTRKGKAGQQAQPAPK